MNCKLLRFAGVLVSCCLCFGISIAQASDAYRFTFAYGPWDLAEGRIDPADQPNDPYFQYVEKIYGAAPLTTSWEWEGQKGYLQGLRLYLAAGELPEALRPLDLTLTRELIDAGKLLPLDDLLKEHAPEFLSAYPETVWNLIRAISPDKKIYYLPDLPSKFYTNAGFIRQDWLDRVGMKVPTTRDELVAVYKAFKEQDANGNGDLNDEIPVSGREGMRFCDDLFQIHGAVVYGGHPRLGWDAEKKQMISHQVSPQMKAAVEFLRSLVEQGLMDPVMPIQKKQDWVAKINANQVGHYFHVIGEINQYSAFMETDKNASWTYLPLVSVPDVPPQKHVYYAGADPSVAIFAITTAAKDPVKILKWYMMATNTMDGLMYQSIGIPGVDWKQTDGNIEILSLKTPFYKYVPITTSQYSRDLLLQTPLGEMKAAILERVLAVGTVGPDDSGIPATVYEGYEDYLPENAVLYREYCSKMVLGALPMSAWDEYVQKWNKQGGEEVLKRATEWYKQVNNIQ